MKTYTVNVYKNGRLNISVGGFENYEKALEFKVLFAKEDKTVEIISV